MKRVLRYFVACVVVLPFVLFVSGARVFVGRQRAIEICGPYATATAKLFLRVILPKIDRPEDFDLFRARTKEKFWLWRPLYDFEVAVENADMLQLHIRNCPFCELLRDIGLPELNPYVCQGDWEFARENKGAWSFARRHEIGNGARFCDHTYLRISKPVASA